MRTHTIKNQSLRKKRAWRVRKNIHGTATRPRMSVHKTNKHIFVQLIDDDNHATLGSISTCSSELRGTEFGHRNKTSAKKLGERIAEIAKNQNIKEVIFDRGSFKYHGILAELADAARAGGLQF